MNRVEMLGFVAAMKELCDNEQYDSVKAVVNVLYEETITKKDKGRKDEKEK